MSNVEIYDTSNSELSSDEYSHDEDDDALMDVAVSKQTPPKSTETSPAKTDNSAATTPRKLSADLDAVVAAAAGSTKTRAPASGSATQRQIKQMQRNNEANYYFKQRSLKWLQRLAKKRDYSRQLKLSLPIREAQARRRRAKRIVNMEQLALQMALQRKRSERTPSPSRSRSRSDSPSGSEVVCLDDTENEDSPEKLNETPALNYAPSVGLQLELATETDATLANNGNVLDEFLTMKPALAAEPISEQVVAVAAGELKKELELPQQELPMQLIVEPAAATSLPMPVEAEATIKRRRSITPPPPVAAVAAAAAAEANVEKRIKPMLAAPEFLDDDIIEFLPVQPMTTMPTTPLSKAATAPSAAVATFRPNIEPGFKLGSPYTLTPSSAGGIDLYTQKKLMCQQRQQPENLTASNSYNLETPPVVEPMEIVYPSEKTLPIKTTSSQQPVVIQQVTVNEAPIFATPYNLQQQQQQHLQLQQHQQLQQQPQQQLQPTAQLLQPRPPKPRSESANRQTQTQTPAAPPPAASPAPPAAPAVPATNARNKPNSVELNNSNNNSDAIFHQRVKELYTELDDIMNDKVRSVKPELKSFDEERMRIEADIETLDNLIAQKETEYNRLLHLRCIKEELRVRIQRKERIVIMKEILPTILNRNCSTSELYELNSLLLSEHNAPMPSSSTRFGLNAMSQLIDRVENSLDDIKMLRGVLGMPEKPAARVDMSMPPPPTQHYGAPSSHHRRNSVPAMRPPQPPVAIDTSAVYGHNEYQHGDAEESMYSARRHKLQPPQSRFQQLINESKQLINSTPDLSAASTYRNRQQQQQQQQSSHHHHQPHHSHPMDAHRSHPNSLDNHFDNDVPVKPLYNSSPLGKQHSQRQVNDIHPHYNDTHSIYRTEDRSRNNNNNNNSINNRSKRFANGPEDQLMERSCQHCERRKATILCGSCKNQWYCSRECQIRAWDAEHCETCTN
ncbi:mediator of DNA damage checkpoint protein 1 [Drosophila grimshawi]|uniref:GH15890 n=1 Tax=Drosophila grimshawi TaxID=7222 RepID=B4J0V0_DROGR|nr:mediator of DNA damage checkpoint protein 1 [Drosophila grimshawi]EDV95771.1 GH15890 [Drosophila grimshawi]